MYKIVGVVAIIAFFTAFLTSALSTAQVSAAVPQTIIRVAPSPVLDRIADCESGNGTKGSARHTKNGQVILMGNTNKTVDVGKYQINAYYWGAKATELGLDITKEADNKKMAEWIYANKGTGDWSASAKCWQR